MSNNEVNENENVELIRNNPKKAILKLAIPTIFSMFAMYLNNLIDSFWVAGINSNAIAALGFISPLYLVMIGIGSGIGVGLNSLISRYIGGKKYEDANNAIIHGFIITVIISIAVLIVGIFFLKDVLVIFGAGDVLSYCLDYGYIIFICNIIFLLPNVIAGIFRAEGNIKRATYPLILAAILNMILDPIFIYVFNLGMFGAAVATIIATLIGLLIMFYWIFVKKDSFLDFKISNYKRKLSIYKEILVVSLPVDLEEILFAVNAIIFNFMIVITAGTSEVAAYTLAWRYVSMGFLPALAIGMATITVTSVSYGAKNYKNFNTTLKYSAFLSFFVTAIISVIFFIFATPLCDIFNYSTANGELVSRSADVLRILIFYNLLSPIGATAVFMYQGVGNGFKSLGLTVLRELVLSIFGGFLCGIVLDMGIIGVYVGSVVGLNIGSVIAFISILRYNNKLKSNPEFVK